MPIAEEITRNERVKLHIKVGLKYVERGQTQTYTALDLIS